MGKLRTIDQLSDLQSKTVILRVDSDVDIVDGKIVDDTRLASSVETIKLLLSKGANINIVGHLGRPEGVDPKFTLRPVAEWFHSNIKNEIANIKETEIGK